MKALVLHNIGGVSISLDAASEKLKAELLSECKDFAVIDDEFTMDCASSLASRMKSLITDEFSTPISTEMNKLLESIKGFLKKQRQAAEEAEKKRMEELRRLELEKAKAEEIIAAPFTAEEVKQAQQTISEITRFKLSSALRAQIPSNPNPKGIVTKTVPQIEVIDLHEIYKHNRDFVRIELNQSAVLVAIRAGKVECPGLKITFEEKVEARR